jgi:N-dimethylarginine dimethylaminohydrolase
VIWACYTPFGKTMTTATDTQREIFLMSPPGANWQLRGRANFRSDGAAQVDAAAAFLEWLSLARAIEDAGGCVLVLPSDDELTGLPFCAEAGHALAPEGPDSRPRFLLPRMWAPHRTREAALWQPFVESLGFRAVCGSGGHWEGQGDVAYFRETPILFFGGRTDADGLSAYRSHFSKDALALEIRQPAFHGNVAFLAVDACDCIVVCPSLLVGEGMAQLEERFGADALITISEEEARAYATNSLPVASHLIAPSIAPTRVLGELETRGMKVISLRMTELCEKAGGASRCLVCRVPAEVARSLDTNALATAMRSLDEVEAARRGLHP